MQAHAATITIKGVTSQVMKDGQFVRVVVYLCISAVCCFVSAVINLRKSRALAAHIASLQGQKA